MKLMSCALVASASVVLAACARPAPPAPAPNPVPQPAETRPAYTGPTSAELVLLGTTDTHGRLYPYDYYTRQTVEYGLARLKPLIDSVRAANPGRTFLFDSGDLLQGNSLPFVYAKLSDEGISATLGRGFVRGANGWTPPTRAPNPVIRGMNLLRYDASTIGNHEYNYGLENLNRAIGEASFPFVTANVFRHGTDEHAYKPYVLLPYAVAPGDTILLGVTGNTPPGVHVWDRANVEGILDFRDVTAALKRVVPEMRAKGADIVIVLSHGGLSGTSYDTATTHLPEENQSARVAREVPGVDVIFMGHTHLEVRDTTINGVLLTQAKNWARSVAAVTMSLARDSANAWHVQQKRATLLKARADLADRAFMDSLRWQHERTVSYVSSVVGRSSAAMTAAEARVRDTPIMDFINEVQRKAAGADLAASAPFSLSAQLPAGPITIADLAGLYIYDNTLKAVRITGAQLRAFLEKSAEYYLPFPGDTLTNPKIPGYNFDVVSGVDYTIDVSRPVGQRITRLEFRGAAVRDEQTFTMALNNYRQTGGGGFAMLANAPVVYDRQQEIRDLLIDEVRARGVIRPEDYFRKNWEIVPAEAAAQALREQAREGRSEAVAQPQRKRIRILTTNDFHGRLQPEKPPYARGREVGGAAALRTYFRLEQAGFGGPAAILDGGDVMQGTPLSNLTQGRSSVDFFNLAGYRAVAVGNHEYDWGVPVLRDRMKQARFPWLSSNTFVEGTERPPAWLHQTAMIDVDGVRVGVIGASTEETPRTTKAANVKGLAFGDGAAAIDRWVPVLRERGADFVVVVAHAGARCDTAGKCEGEILDWARKIQHRPDLIVAGHSHWLVNLVENGIPITEAGSYSTRYGVIDMERSGDSVSVWVRGVPTAYADRVPADSAAAALVARYTKQIGPRVNEVITVFGDSLPDRPRTEYPLGRLIADAQRAAGNAQVAILNNGGIRAGLYPGPVTWQKLFEIQPFENRLVRLHMRGADLRAAIEHIVRTGAPSAQVSGLTATYDTTRAPGQRLLDLRLSTGEEIRDDGVYTVVVNDFMATGGDGFTSLEKSVRWEDLGIVDLEALITYLRAQPKPVHAPTEQRLRIAR